MSELPFRLDLIQYLAAHRTDLLTRVFSAFTFLGELEGYILVIVLIYVAVDKKLGLRLAVVTLAAMSLNHALKTIIRNPRPFIGDGSYARQWAVSPATAADLATEYSTPSGHAMAGSAFYVYLYANVANLYARIGFVFLIVVIGLSRPYLGVHYFEDVVSGWVLGTLLAWFAIRQEESIAARWTRFSGGRQALILVASSLALWLATRGLSDWSANEPPSAFVSYAGLLTGILLGGPLEEKRVNFDPRSGSLGSKMARYALSVGMVIGTLLLLGLTFDAISAKGSAVGHLLRYVRYTAAGLVGIFVAPLVFVRLGLAEPMRPKAACAGSLAGNEATTNAGRVVPGM